ncbi:MAG TPA: VCBS repeat-containing protein [Polyangiaceae bacterium]
MNFELFGRTRTVGLLFIALGVAVACSASKSGGSGVRPDTPGGGTGSSTGGQGPLGGGDGPILNFGGASSGGANTGGAPAVVHTACSKNSDCTDPKAVCVKPGPDSGITAAGECAPAIGACAADDMCAQDSYCCGAGCRLDDGDKVCIPFDFGATPDCKLPGAALGVFAPAVQCEWAPDAKDPNAASKYVLATPLVADLPNDSGASAEVVFSTWDAMTTAAGVTPATDGGSSSAVGMIRIVSGQTCALEETIADSIGKVRASTPLALADLDNNGTIDIVARLDQGGAIAFKWDGMKFVKMWETPSKLPEPQAWDGPAIHDLDDDGKPEVLLADQVYNGQTGALITPGGMVTNTFNGYLSVAGLLNGDGMVKLVAGTANETSTLGWSGTAWVDDATLHQGQRLGFNSGNYAIADFGTPDGLGGFDLTKLDGIAEIVEVEGQYGGVNIFANSLPMTNGVVAKALTVTGTSFTRGGPPTVGDFDGDGQPEVAVAGSKELAVFDPGCAGPGNGCLEKYIRWRQPSQDSSSGQTGVSLFDFDGDGKVEVVYADECFLRVYSGPTGEVLFSAYRTSATWFESPVIADVDKDDATEIVVNNAMAVGCSDARTQIAPSGTPYVDPLDPGVRCQDNGDCVPGGKCTAGFCRCAGAMDCDTGLSCVAPPAKSVNVPNPPMASDGNVCRATNPNTTTSKGGIRILKDRLDRTASSRSLWNQHAYSITNINDDGTIPKTSAWLPNWKQPGMNNYRMQKQGAAGAQDAPDLTGKLDPQGACIIDGATITLTGKVCNRGSKAVGADMPVTFYDESNKVLCVSHTLTPVKGKNDCQPVSCTIKDKVMGKITMKVNDDNGGGQTAKECNSTNNTDTVTIDGCNIK